MKTQSVRACLPLDPTARVLLHVARAERGLSLKQLSVATGITTAQLCRYETGVANPTFATLTRLCAFLGLEFIYPTCHVWRDPMKSRHNFGQSG